MIEVTAVALAAHPFLYGMPHDHLAVLADAGLDVTFPAKHRLIEDGHSATRFWLIQSGHVTLDLHVPGQGLMSIETIGMGGRAAPPTPCSGTRSRIGSRASSPSGCSPPGAG